MSSQCSTRSYQAATCHGDLSQFSGGGFFHCQKGRTDRILVGVETHHGQECALCHDCLYVTRFPQECVFKKEENECSRQATTALGLGARGHWHVGRAVGRNGHSSGRCHQDTHDDPGSFPTDTLSNSFGLCADHVAHRRTTDLLCWFQATKHVHVFVVGQHVCIEWSF